MRVIERSKELMCVGISSVPRGELEIVELFNLVQVNEGMPGSRNVPAASERPEAEDYILSEAIVKHV